MSEAIVPAAQPQALEPAAARATVEMGRDGAIIKVGFDTERGFEALQRVGKAFAASTLVPDSYKGNLANCIIAVEMSSRMGASPLMVMQNLYLVQGRPSWSSQFLIAAFNNCGKFSAIKYRWTGKPGTKDWGCQAWAKERETGELVEGPLVTISMAEAEGWISKKGSKWQTMPQLMLTYRAATFLVRTTAPELTMGLKSAEESFDGSAVEEWEAALPAPEPTKGAEGLRAAAARAKAAASKPAPEPAVAPEQAPAAQAAPAAELAEKVEEVPVQQEMLDLLKVVKTPESLGHWFTRLRQLKLDKLITEEDLVYLRTEGEKVEKAILAKS